MNIETSVVHAGRSVEPVTGAVTPPIQLSTTFERDADGGYSRGFMYSRKNNPNRQSLEKCLAVLEGGATAAAFASGTAATMSVFQALAPGNHVIAPHDAYYGTTYLLRDMFSRWGLETTFVETTDPEQVRQAIRKNTKLLWLETPSNPLLRVCDIAALAAMAHDAGALCVCDNTFATPILQRPLDLGADAVVHSTTKYLTGHSDVVGGAVISKMDGELFKRIRDLQANGGAVPSPFDCWLTMRGIQTLACRIRVHAQNALQIATFLGNHDRVEAVHYPGLAQHPDHALATRQMKGFGGMVSFQVKGDREAALAVAAKARLFIRATSLGGTHSLIEHRASIEGPQTPTPQNLLRLSVGIEHVADLIEDLTQALTGGRS